MSTSLKTSRKTTKNVIFITFLICFYGLFFSKSSEVFASTLGIGKIGETVVDDMIDNLAAFVLSMVYFLGVGLGFVGLVKFKAYKLNPNQEKLSTACIYLAVATAAIWMPSLMTAVSTSVFEKQNIEGPDSSFGPGGNDNPFTQGGNN